MAIELTTDNVIGALMRAVASKPQGYVYTNPQGIEADPTYPTACHYVHGSGDKAVCGCIVGTALHDLGVPLDALSSQEGQPAYAVLMALESEGILTFDGQVSALMDTVQACQDTGETWQDSVVKALKHVG